MHFIKYKTVNNLTHAGFGKTYLAAFDVLNFNPKRLLYIVHEGSILMKSVETFSRVFGTDKTFGIYNADYKDFYSDFVFSTNVTMANALELFEPHTFDYIIIDKAHHATVSTYKKIIDYFEPHILLGITATPGRMDGEDVFSLFDQNVPYEKRLRDAIVNRLVVPFHYYGIRDELIEYGIKETKGHKFVEQFSDEKHCDFIYQTIEKHRIPGQKLKALAFCRDISHAIRMSQAMEDYYNTRYLPGKNSTGECVRAYKDLQDDNAELEILFTVGRRIRRQSLYSSWDEAFVIMKGNSTSPYWILSGTIISAACRSHLPLAGWRRTLSWRKSCWHRL